jgi:hypothetical protein
MVPKSVHNIMSVGSMLPCTQLYLNFNFNLILFVIIKYFLFFMIVCCCIFVIISNTVVLTFSTYLGYTVRM